MGRLLSVDETVEYLGETFSAAALRKMAHRQQIPHVKVNRRLLFDRVELDKWIKAHTVRVAS